jgi:hypothetical protein
MTDAERELLVLCAQEISRLAQQDVAGANDYLRAYTKAENKQPFKEHVDSQRRLLERSRQVVNRVQKLVSGLKYEPEEERPCPGSEPGKEHPFTRGISGACEVCGYGRKVDAMNDRGVK